MFTDRSQYITALETYTSKLVVSFHMCSFSLYFHCCVIHLSDDPLTCRQSCIFSQFCVKHKNDACNMNTVWHSSVLSVCWAAGEHIRKITSHQTSIDESVCVLLFKVRGVWMFLIECLLTKSYLIFYNLFINKDHFLQISTFP